VRWTLFVVLGFYSYSTPQTVNPKVVAHNQHRYSISTAPSHIRPSSSAAHAQLSAEQARTAAMEHQRGVLQAMRERRLTNASAAAAEAAAAAAEDDKEEEEQEAVADAGSRRARGAFVGHAEYI